MKYLTERERKNLPQEINRLWNLILIADNCHSKQFRETTIDLFYFLEAYDKHLNLKKVIL
jgi:hypothetical protein